MNQNYQFAKPFQHAQGSAIRELFKYMSRTGMISFAGGYPSPALFDRAGLDAAMEKTRFAGSAEILQYGATEGRPALREAFCSLLNQRGITATQDRMLVTSGSQQGFDLLVRALIEPGDVALVTRPAYAAALQGLRLAGARLVTVETNAGGLDCDKLDRYLAMSAQRPKLLYCVPTFANPTGDTFTLEQRHRLLELAVRHKILLVEDDPYGELRFSGSPIPPLAALASNVPGASEWVVYLSSLSKIVAPGLRIGMLLAPSEVLLRCVLAKQVADLCTSPWMQLVAENYLQSGALARHLGTAIAAYKERCDTMTAALQAELGHCLEFSAPQGGMFIWGVWKNGVDATQLLERAIEANVMYVPGLSFYADAPDRSAIRLSFAMPPVSDIVEGVRRLRIAYDRHTES